jgi:hypothetical protein
MAAQQSDFDATTRDAYNARSAEEIDGSNAEQ